jgi:hypothetical protein
MPERDELYRLIAQITEADDFTWGLLTLSDEAMCNCFSRSQAEEIVNESIHCGNYEAIRLLKMYPEQSPEDIAQVLGLPIRVVDFKTSEKSKMIYFGQYVKGAIVIPEDMVREIGRQYEAAGLGDLMGKIDAKSLMISHELFHFREEKDKSLITNTMKVRVKTLNFFHQNITPLCASEIAAFAFAKTLSASEVHPRILEVIGAYSVKPDLSQGIVRRLTAIMAS